MSTEKKILLTGAAGFIGSYLLGYLNQQGISNIVIADDFNRADKESNYHNKQFLEKIERSVLFSWLDQSNDIGFVFHLGARTDTAEYDYSVHEELNLNYSKKIWAYCAQNEIPLVYASSAATYGGGELGYSDSHQVVSDLQPLNPYGVSKNEFDKWVLDQLKNSNPSVPPFWAGLKFFNVYGPNEYHKGRMASMIFHGYHQVRSTGKVNLFKSHREDYKDGEQLRDFIYVKDIARVCFWLYNNQSGSGIYNLGTGEARSFNDLIKAVFNAMDIKPEIEYIDMPEDIRDAYQYFTEAEMDKLRHAGYTEPFHTLEQGVQEYVSEYLTPGKYF